MTWHNIFQSDEQGARNSARRRTPGQSGLSHIEALENRLALGGFSDPGSSGWNDSNGASPIPGDVQSDSSQEFQSPSNENDGLPSSSSPSGNETETSAQSQSSAHSPSSGPAVNGLDVGLDSSLFSSLHTGEGANSGEDPFADEELASFSALESQSAPAGNGEYVAEESSDGVGQTALATAAFEGGEYDQDMMGAGNTIVSALSREDAVKAALSGSHFSVATAQLNLNNPNEVKTLLDRASAATPSQDAIIAIVDRNGRILGVRVEDGVHPNILNNPDNLIFAIDGAVAKARTAAFFSNGDPGNGTLAPLTSRLVGFLSGTTVTQREVESNPNIADPTSTIRGPGLVAPIGLGGHFPPQIPFNPPVDLFQIEATNRDSLLHPGADGRKNTADDVVLPGRFNIAPNEFGPGKELFAPESFGGPQYQSRGIATLPGGIPIYRDQNLDGIGETLIGGIGVFFPGRDGFATYEQGFIPNIGQGREQRFNGGRTLEAEYIAFAALGGSTLAGARVGTLGGVDPIADIDLPFGRLDLVGITLQVLGPIAGRLGVKQVLEIGVNKGQGVVNGTDQIDSTLQVGMVVPEGWIVPPRDAADGSLSAEDVRQIIMRGINQADLTRAAIRLDSTNARPGKRTEMVLAVADKDGNILGLFRMPDATVFSIDVAVAKARNASYYADATALQAIDQVPGVAPGVAFTARTFRFLGEPRFPSGIDFTPPPPFSNLNDPGVNPLTAENLAGPVGANEIQSVVGFNSFNPGTNFRDPQTNASGNANGVVFFPGSTPLYRADGTLLGGFGVSGDGVDQDDVVTFFGAGQFLPPRNVTRADEVFVRGVRLPYQKFNRNPLG